MESITLVATSLSCRTSEPLMKTYLANRRGKCLEHSIPCTHPSNRLPRGGITTRLAKDPGPPIKGPQRFRRRCRGSDQGGRSSKADKATLFAGFFGTLLTQVTDST